MVVLREGYININMLAGTMSYELILKARYERAGAESERILLALASVKMHPVDAPVEIYNCRITVLCGSSLDAHQTCIALLLLGNSLIHVLISDSLVCLGDLDSLVGAQLDLGSDRYQRGIYKILAGFDLRHLDLGSGYDIKLRLLDNLGI